MLQTCMKEHLKSNYLRRASGADASPSVRTGIRTKRLAPRRRLGELNKPLATSAPSFHPARGLMICLGWLRLFQAIVPNGIPSARRPFSHET